MKRTFIIKIFSFLFILSAGLAFAEETKPKYSIDIRIKDIPEGQQTLFVPIKIDTMIVDFDKVALEGLTAQNILAVASTSKDKVGPGIGLLKLDNNGLPQNLELKVFLKPTGTGQTTVTLLKFADGPVLPAKGTEILNDVNVSIDGSNEIEITEKIEKENKRLVPSQNKLTLQVQRQAQKEESIFVPFLFDKTIVDLDETFGHAIVGPGITAKSFSSGSLHEGGPGVEIVLSDVAEKEFTFDIDLVPRKSGKSSINLALPQKGHVALVSGPIVDILPSTLDVINTTALNE